VNLYPSQLPGQRVYWLLEIKWGGLVIRLADDQVDVESETGTVYQYAPGLDAIEVSEAIELFNDSAGQLSIPLEFVAPPGASITERISLGDDFSAATGELSRWVSGTSYEARRVVLVGRLTDPEFGADGEPIATSLDETVVNDSTLVPGPYLTVTSSTWSHFEDLPEIAKGAPYPIIIGKPGRVSTDISPQGWITGSPGIWVWHDPQDEGSFYSRLILLIAGHHVRARAVYLNTENDTTGHRFRVINSWDDRGQPVALVPFYVSTTSDQQIIYDVTASYTTYDATDGDFTPAAASYGLGDKGLNYDAWQADANITPFVGWYDGNDDDSATGGGVVMDGGIVREAGDVIEYLLGLTTQRVDWGRIAAAKPLLSRFLLDGVITDRVSPWDVLKDEILPLLPVSLCSGPNGLYVVVWQFDATAADATVRIDADANPAIGREGRVKYDSEDRANRISLSYAYSYRAGTYCAQVVFGAAEDVETDPSTVVHALCDFSRRRVGYVVDRSTQTAWVYDTSTAYAVCEWQAAAYALPSKTVQYRVPELDFVHVERGQVATLTDSDLYLSEALCLVREVVTDGSGYLTLTLWMIDNPVARMA
jgi:hypothetical protein